MAKAIQFIPDPQIPNAADHGVGTFHFDTGEQLYGQNPEMARGLLSDPSRGALADASGASPAAPLMSQQPETMTRSDAAPNMTPQPAPALSPAAGPAPTPEAAQPQPPPQGYRVNPNKTVQVTDTSRGPTVVGKGLNEQVESSGLTPELAEDSIQKRRALQEKVIAARTAQADAAETHAVNQSIAEQIQLDDAETEVERRRKLEDDARHEAATLSAQAAEDGKKAVQKVDQSKIFKDRGALFSIGTILGQSLGAWSASMGGGPNYAKQMVDRMIETDIAEQRAEIERGQADKNNRLAQLKAQLGNMGQAEAALRLAQRRAVEQQAKRNAAIAEQGKPRADLEAWTADYALDSQKTEEDLIKQTLGKRTTTTASDIKYPTRSAQVAKTPMEMLAEQDEASKHGASIYKNEKTMAGEDDEKQKDEKDRQWELAKSQADKAAFNTAIKNHAEKIGLKRDPESGRWYKPEGVDLKGYGGLDTLVRQGKHFLGLADDVQQSQDSLVDLTGRDRSGAAITPDERPEFKNITVGNESEEGLISGLNLIQADAEAPVKVLEAGAGSKTVKKTDKERKEIHNYQAGKARPTAR